jgi:hypothetical protein
MGSKVFGHFYTDKTATTAWILAISQQTAQVSRHPAVDGLHSIDK